MKSRYSTFDLKAVISELQQCIGLRVANVYDVDSKTYLLKLSKGEKKSIVLIESGIRIHTTAFDWPKSQMPSGFSMKLRKHIRTRRLNAVRQLGIDRVADFEFGHGETLCHLLVELYAKGNIVLTDGDYTILAVLRARTHVMKSEEGGEIEQQPIKEEKTKGSKKASDDHNDDVRIAVGTVYPFQLAKTEYENTTVESLLQKIQSVNPQDNIKKTINSLYDYGPGVVEHCILKSQLDPSKSIADCGLSEEGSQSLLALFQALEEGKELMSGAQSAQGYIIQKEEKKASMDDQPVETMLVYDEFHPTLLHQHQGKPFVQFPSFNEAVDEYFSRIESQKLDVKTLQQQKTALKKLDFVRKDHEERVAGLQVEQLKDKALAELIENNLEKVDAAIMAVNSLLSTGMSWDNVQDMLDEAKALGDSVAKMITSMALEKNTMRMLLSNPYDDVDENGNPIPSKPVKVEIDLAINAYNNARKFYDRKKQARIKEGKTLSASSQAMKSAERATKAKLKEVEIKASITKARKIYWFEKFTWFISSENYLVIAGRDAQQNELLVKKHLKKGDIYIHANLDGGASCIIKNPTPETLPPPKTMQEAGVMAICYSAAWDAKIVISAYWVHSHQVSKMAPTGEYLTTGSFMIRGKKNFLPPAQLVMGFGFLYRIDDSCIGNHIGERKCRLGLEDDDVIMTAKDYEERSHLMQTRSRKHGKETEKETNKEKELKVCSDHSEGEEGELEQGVKDININTNDLVSQSANEVQHVTEVAEHTDEMIGGDDDDDEEEIEFPETGVDTVSNYLLATNTVSTSETNEEDSEVASTSVGQESKRVYVTAKQRRDMKKKNSTEEVNMQTPSTKSSSKSTGSQEDSKKKSSSVTQKEQDVTESDEARTPTPVPRGKKGKMRKMKEKYKDQDDDERALRMNLLKSAGVSTNGNKGKGAKKGKEGKAQVGSKPPKVQDSKQVEAARQAAAVLLGGSQATPSWPPAPLITDKKEKVPVEATVAEGVEVDLSEDEQGTITEEKDRDLIRASRMERRKEQKQENEELKALMAEENIIDDDDRDTQLGMLDVLTGMPKPDDLLLYAMAFCGPYSAVQNFKYKAKLTPGGQRKGKAARQARDMFVKLSDNPTEKELLRAVGDNELTAQLPGKVKITIPKSEGKKK